MKHFIVFILISLLTLSVGEATPYALQDQMIEKLDRFEKALEWLVSYREQLTEEQRETLEEFGLLSEIEGANKTFAEEAKSAQASFQEFRQHIYQLVLAVNAGNPQVGTLLIGSQAELVNWYIAYMENLLFPHDWEQAYLDQEGGKP